MSALRVFLKKAAAVSPAQGMLPPEGCRQTLTSVLLRAEKKFCSSADTPSRPCRDQCRYPVQISLLCSSADTPRVASVCCIRLSLRDFSCGEISAETFELSPALEFSGPSAAHFRDSSVQNDSSYIEALEFSGPSAAHFRAFRASSVQNHSSDIQALELA